MASNTKHRLLIVEDSDAKYAVLSDLIGNTFRDIADSERASTITDAEARITSEQWSVIVLDVSMDITKTTAGAKLGGHATLGGLGIATKMYLLGCEVPTVIVTAFDIFEESQAERAQLETLGLEDIKRRAEEILGSSFLGCVRYGDPGWQSLLTQHLRVVLQ